MNFPPFWAKGTYENFICWRWSNHSPGEAQSAAKEAARKLAERFASGKTPFNRYGYGDRPMREPVLRELKNGSGDVAAAITRNSYGCLVLNTARVMFVDVDLPELDRAGGGQGFFGRLFGKPQASSHDDVVARALTRAEAWVNQHPDWSWRAYRTRAGLRLLATHGLFDADAAFT